jgi:hypothetical protein
MSALVTTDLLTFGLILLAALSWGKLSRFMFHSVARSGNPTGFWGKESWLRKYKLDHLDRPTLAKKTWYTKLFPAVKYKEKFPLSATLFVFLSDGFHLCQFITMKSLLFAVSLQTENVLQSFIAIVIVSHVGFYFTYYKR